MTLTDNGSRSPSLELSPSKKELLAKRLSGAFRASSGAQLILPRSESGPAPLSFVQQQLWVLDQMQPGSVAYNLTLPLRLHGNLEPVILEKALNEILRRHEVLRVTFPSVEGEPALFASPFEMRPLPMVDLREQQPREREAGLGKLMEEAARQPFDLAHGPLVRWQLLRSGDQEHILILSMHHIISDGWSIDLFFRELQALYEAFLRGIPGKVPALRIQYADFAFWQRTYMQGQVLEDHLSYWKQNLAGARLSIALPAASRPIAGGPLEEDSTLHNGRTSRASRLAAPAGQQTIPVGKDLTEALSAFSQREGVSPFITMLSALNILLFKWTQQSDLVIGTVVAGRTHREIEDLIGCFMNFLPLRTKISGDPTSLEFLAQVKVTVLEAYAHQDCPFEKIVEAIKPARSLHQNPLFNVAFLLQNFPHGDLQNGLLKAEFLPVKPQTPLLDLRFLAEESENGLSLTCEYDTGMFTAETINLLVAAFRESLEMLVREPLKRVSELDLDKRLIVRGPGQEQKPEQLLAISASFTGEPLGESLAFWMEKLELPIQTQFAPYNQIFQQLLDPSSLLGANRRGINVVLLRFEDWDKPEAGTGAAGPPALNGQLEKNSQELALALKTAAGRSTVPWLVCICPSSKRAIANAERRQLFARLERELAKALSGLSGVHLVTPKDISELYPVADFDDPHGDELGHIPYTPILFAALGTFIARKIHALRSAPRKVIVLDCDQTLWTGVCGEDGPAGVRIDAPRRVLQEFMRAQLEAGRLLCLCSKNSEGDVRAVFELCPNMPLQFDHFVAWRINWHPKSENLRALAEELQLGLDSFVLVDDNPLECAEAQANCPEVATLQLPEDSKLIPGFLKQAWVFDQVKVTDEDRNRTALYQQNRQRGRFREQTLNLAEFLAGLNLKVEIQPAQAGQLARIAQLMQRTNQFNFTTRRRSESELEQLCREAHPGILAVSVTDRFGDYGLVGVLIYERVEESLRVDTFLLSCRVLGKGIEHRMLARLGQLALVEGRRWIDIQFIPSSRNKPALDFLEKVGVSFEHRGKDRLDFKFPAEFARDITFNPERAQPPPREQLQTSFPDGLNSGLDARLQISASKIGWIALNTQDPGMILNMLQSKLTARGAEKGDFFPPRTEIEAQLCRVWEKLLRIERVGIQDDFFELGGSSLLAVQLLAQTRKVTGQNLPLAALFQAPTVEQLARLIENKPLARSPLVALQPTGSKPPLVLMHGAGGGILWGYANLAAHLGSDQPVYAIEPQTTGKDTASVEEMAARYITELRALQPSGPYFLGGYCFGGYVAYEMARQLAAQGEAAALTVLIDCAAPNGSYERARWWRPSFLPNFFRNLGYWLKDFFNLEPKAQFDFARRQIGVLAKKLLGHRRGEGNKPIHLEQYINLSELPEHELELWRLHLRAGADYVPGRYPGRVTLLRTRAQPLLCSFDPSCGWGDLAEGVEIRMVPGSHENIFMEPDVQSLAEHLKTYLAGAQSRVGGQQLEREPSRVA